MVYRFRHQYLSNFHSNSNSHCWRLILVIKKKCSEFNHKVEEYEENTVLNHNLVFKLFSCMNGTFNDLVHEISNFSCFQRIKHFSNFQVIPHCNFTCCSQKCSFSEAFWWCPIFWFQSNFLKCQWESVKS